MQAGVQPVAFGVTINSVNQPSTFVGQITNGVNDAKVLVGSSILTLPAGAMLTLRNVGSTTAALYAATSANIVNAIFRIVKISS
jgi:hypothetical protein